MACCRGLRILHTSTEYVTNVPSIWGFCKTPKNVLSAMISFISFINLLSLHMCATTLVTSKLGSLDSHFTKILKDGEPNNSSFLVLFKCVFFKKGPSFNNYLEQMQLSHKNGVFYHMSCLAGGFFRCPRFPKPQALWRHLLFGLLAPHEVPSGSVKCVGGKSKGGMVNGDTEKMADMPLFTGFGIHPRWLVWDF